MPVGVEVDRTGRLFAMILPQRQILSVEKEVRRRGGVFVAASQSGITIR
jgi:hypothetical protein